MPKHQPTAAKKARAAARQTGAKYTTVLRGEPSAPAAKDVITPAFLQKCTDPKRARDQACRITPGSGAAFWDSVVLDTVQAYLLAAALGGVTPQTLARWVADEDDQAPAEILRGHPQVPAAMHLQFEQVKGDGRTQTTVRQVVRMAVLR